MARVGRSCACGTQLGMTSGSPEMLRALWLHPKSIQHPIGMYFPYGRTHSCQVPSNIHKKYHNRTAVRWNSDAGSLYSSLRKLQVPRPDYLMGRGCPLSVPPIPRALPKAEDKPAEQFLCCLSSKWHQISAKSHILELQCLNCPKTALKMIFRHHWLDSGSVSWCSVFVADGSGDRKASGLSQHWALNTGVSALSVSKCAPQSSKALEKIPLPCNRNEVMRAHQKQVASERDFHPST